MERNFTNENENLEEFLRQNADELRMRPSGNVWKGISKRLNQRRRRIGFILCISLLATSGLVYYLLENTVGNSTDALTGKETIAAKNPERSSTIKTSKPGSDFQKQASINSEFIERNEVSYQPKSSSFINENIQQGTNFFDVTTNASSVGTNDLLIAENDFVPTVIDSYPGNETNINAVKPIDNKPDLRSDPLSIESVVNSYTKEKNKKLTLQVFFTPTVSYRRLTENKSYTRTTSPNNIPSTFQGLYDINSAVTHKPDFGFELGTMAKYPVGKNFKLRAGLQFNISRYDIKTFSSTYQIGTIRFNNRDSLNTVSGYNNFNGYKSDWLQSFYFQVSMPVGLEYKIAGNGKSEIGVATSIQPTYLLNDRAYLITSDYKTYVEVPWLVRKWNLNTSFETFVSYKTGKLKWQVGPQVRYQLKSSFEKKYPVKENLFDFGLKVGLSLNKQ